jgi:hypothetical protein
MAPKSLEHAAADTAAWVKKELSFRMVPAERISVAVKQTTHFQSRMLKPSKILGKFILIWCRIPRQVFSE